MSFKRQTLGSHEDLNRWNAMTMAMAMARTMAHGHGRDADHVLWPRPCHGHAMALCHHNCISKKDHREKGYMLKEFPFKCLRLLSMYSATDLDDSIFEKIEKSTTSSFKMQSREVPRNLPKEYSLYGGEGSD